MTFHASGTRKLSLGALFRALLRSATTARAGGGTTPRHAPMACGGPRWLLVAVLSYLVLADGCGAKGSAWVHDGVDINLFRGTPVTGPQPVVGQVSTLGFTLEYLDVCSALSQSTGCITPGTNQWTLLRWEQLEEYHGSRVHVNVLSADGDDYYHVHPEYTSFVVKDTQTDLGVDIAFLQPGLHMVTATWVVEISSLNLCTIERIKHAHGLSNNAMLYPLLSATWTVDVASGSVAVDGGGDKLPPEQRLLATSQATLACGKPASIVGAYHTYNHSYELAESVTCCCSAASAEHLGTHTAHCTDRCPAGGGCVRVAATATSLGATAVSTVAGETRYPAATCMAVAIEVSDAQTGESLTLSPYLGAAAHVYVAPADVTATSMLCAISPPLPHTLPHPPPLPPSLSTLPPRAARSGLTTHAHAYTSLNVGGLNNLDKAVCEDFSQMGTYPMVALPESFGGTVCTRSPPRALAAPPPSPAFEPMQPLPPRRAPRAAQPIERPAVAQVYALVLLPAAGAWRVIFSLRRGESLLSAGFEWRTHGQDHISAANATCPAVAESGGVEGGSAAAVRSCAAFLRHDPAALVNHEFGCVGPANASACGASGASSSALSLSDCCAAIAPYRGEDCTTPPAAPPAAPPPPATPPTEPPAAPPVVPPATPPPPPPPPSCPGGPCWWVKGAPPGWLSSSTAEPADTVQYTDSWQFTSTDATSGVHPLGALSYDLPLAPFDASQGDLHSVHMLFTAVVMFEGMLGDAGGGSGGAASGECAFSYGNGTSSHTSHAFYGTGAGNGGGGSPGQMDRWDFNVVGELMLTSGMESALLGLSSASYVDAGAQQCDAALCQAESLGMAQIGMCGPVCADDAAVLTQLTWGPTTTEGDWSVPTMFQYDINAGSFVYVNVTLQVDVSVTFRYLATPSSPLLAPPPPAPPLPSAPSPSLRSPTVLAPSTPDLAAPSPSPSLSSPPSSSPGTPTLPAEAGTEADMTAESSDVLSTGAIVGIVAALAAVLLLGLCLALIVTGRMRVVTGVRSRFRFKRREEPHLQVGRLGPPAVMSEIAVFAVGEGESEATLPGHQPGQPETVPKVEVEIKV